MTANAGSDGDPLPQLLAAAADAAQAVTDAAAARLRPRLTDGGRVSLSALEARQHAAHGLAWIATYGVALRALADWAVRLDADGRLGAVEALCARIVAGEYLAQIAGGLPMSQGEIVRPQALGLAAADLERAMGGARALMHEGNSAENRARLVALMREDGSVPDVCLDETLAAMRVQMRRFTDTEVAPHAQAWHLADAYVPMATVDALANLGVFALTVPEAYGGLGLGKSAMCVVSEELSRGWIAVGSLGTRSEIASELILAGGTEEQKRRWLPGIASGGVLPTAVFTEPDTGSDLGDVRTRAVREGGVYRITGQKTWITHAARADLMTLLARTGPPGSGHRGLSMFLAPKPRGNADDPFPARGMSGGEIGVIGYRGMKEFEISFDGFEVPAEGLLGGEEGRGFTQLMQTFESARIQTAARAVGVAQAALDTALAYARSRVQFGRPIAAFPRVADKLAMMAAETLAARLIALHAARRKDAGRRCDLEAGMAKLLAARVAWAAADNCVQIHGGNGFALEYPASRLLCDARILNIFEGAAEIQANIIARRLLEDGA